MNHDLFAFNDSHLNCLIFFYKLLEILQKKNKIKSIEKYVLF